MFRPDQNPNKEPQADTANEPKVVSIDDLTQTKEEKVPTPPNEKNLQEKEEDS